MKKPWFLVVFFGLASSLLAQNVGKLTGRIVDMKTKEPIPSANVILRGTSLGAATDLEGVFIILNIPPGEYDVQASIIGYQPVIQKKVLIHGGRTTTVNFELVEETIEQAAIEIVAERPEVEKEKTSTSEILRTEDVVYMPSVRDVSDVLALCSDVVDGHFRGGRDGEEAYILSGMGITNPLNNSSAFTPILSAIEEVEVITSGFSAQYGNAQSGVVNISMKEGRNDKWRAHAEVRTRIPGYKHFGPSVFDENHQPYLQLLNSPDKWKGYDPNATNPTPYYATITYGFTSKYTDTTQAAEIAYALWKQANRDLNRRYNNLWDYSIDANINGPLSRTARMFFAVQVDKFYPIVPTPTPNFKQQFMGNIVQDIGSLSIRVSGAYSRRNEYILPGVGSSYYASFQNWLIDRVIGLPQLREENYQAGLRSVYAFSATTFLEVKVNMLRTHYLDGVRVAEPGRFVSDDANVALWTYYNVPSGTPRVGNMDNDWRNESTQTISLDASLTSQITQNHLILSGIQMNVYSISVDNKISFSSATGARIEQFHAKPYEIGVYVQDKMEFQGMIANVGLRFDAYNQNVDAYVDAFSPFRYRDSLGNYHYDPSKAPKERTPLVARLQPRIGISFPVTLTTVFHLNYGSFLQRPSFERSIYLQLPRTNFNAMTLGNPRLLPQDTKSYDVGVTQGLGEGFTLDMSGYYKDVKNLIEQAIYYDESGNVYRTFVNRDYADIRGFSFRISKRKGFLKGSVRYNYSVATGKSSNPFNAPVIYREKPAVGQLAVELPSPKDILLDFDRTHNFIVNISMASEKNWGPRILGFYPLEQCTVSATSVFRSGRPYTSTSQDLGLGLINNRRTPNEYNTDLKISKSIRNVMGVAVTFYVEIKNVFNQKIYSYNTVFQTMTASGGSSTAEMNKNIDLFESNPENLRWYNINSPFLVDQSFLIYSNSPRSYYIGVTMDF